MKRLIRHKVTGDFFQGQRERWTHDVQKATVFENTPSLIETASAKNLTDVEIYFLMGEKTSAYDVVLPIRERLAAWGHLPAFIALIERVVS